MFSEGVLCVSSCALIFLCGRSFDLVVFRGLYPNLHSLLMRSCYLYFLQWMVVICSFVDFGESACGSSVVFGVLLFLVVNFWVLFLVCVVVWT